MKFGIGLQLQEAWKRQFDQRRSDLSSTVNAVKEVEELSDDSPIDDQGPFKQFTKPLPSKAKPAHPPINASLGYRNECITVDARLNKKGEYVLVKGSEAFDSSQDAKKRKANSLLDPYCLVVTRRFNAMGMLQDTILEIQSQELINIIRDLVEYYPDNGFRLGDTIKCEDPPKLIYYHRKELAEYKARSSTSEHEKLHIGFLLSFLYSHIGAEIDKYETFLEAGMVSFKHLWMMFKPGSLVYEREQEQLCYLEKADYTETECGPVYALECHYIDYNGEKVGKVKRILVIRGFQNQRQLDAVPVIPLDLHPDPESLKQTLHTRAQRFLDLRGIHSMQHTTKGRVMVDAKTFLRRVLPGDEDRTDSQKKGMVIFEDSKCICPTCSEQTDEKPEDYDHPLRELNSQDLLLCSSRVLGFALNSHKWIQMKISDLSEIKWSETAIDRLVLDKRQKRVLSSLISSPVFTEGVEGDVIGWKGKGLVMLLHGAPGTGKTLTAESICESLKRPLYIVSGGELGVSPGEVEKSLEEILELSKLWKAVILIDEADVFLEARSAQDIVRNNFVSVFLRRLEYFEGILLLTTNRVSEFDSAFISRIHLALNYPELEPWRRKEIWTNALKNFPSEQIAIDFECGDLDELAKVSLNGRIISYAVRTAKAIADEDKAKLGMEHLWDVVGVQQKFSECLKKEKSVVGK